MRFLSVANTSLGSALLAISALAGSSPIPNRAVDQLIPWLLDEDRQLRGVPFSAVILDTTGKKVLPFEATNPADQRVVKAISGACDATMKRLNAPDSPIQNIDRINEVSSHFEDSLRELLNTTPGFALPTSAHSRRQGATFWLSRLAHRGSREQARFLPGPETLRQRKSRQQFSHLLLRAKKRYEQSARRCGTFRGWIRAPAASCSLAQSRRF